MGKGKSSDERELFLLEVQGVKRFLSDRVDPARKRVSPRVTPAPENRGQDEKVDIYYPVPEVEVLTEDRLSYSRPGIQRRLLKELCRGRFGPDPALDLHGMRITEARTALFRFLDDCKSRQLRSALVIHGKGIGSGQRQPVLKKQVNLWLRQRKDVLAFCSAAPRDGGTGAVYLLLRNPGKPGSGC